MFDLITENELVVSSYEYAQQLAQLLIEEHYVVMISKEDNLYVVNYIYSPQSDRNDVVFVSREDWDMAFFDGELQMVVKDDVEIDEYVEEPNFSDAEQEWIDEWNRRMTK